MSYGVSNMRPGRQILTFLLLLLASTAWTTTPVLAKTPLPKQRVAAKTTRSAAKPHGRKPTRGRPRRKAPVKPVTVDLVWHVETLDGRQIDSHRADEPINPASVVKAATSLWALSTLGPGHRFTTRFASAELPDASGALPGDLVIDGQGDPDFQPENAFLVAATLNRMGIHVVRGALVVSHDFWIGYEGGSERRETDPVKRALQMAARLQQAFDPARWTRGHQQSWQETALRHGLDPLQPPSVMIEGGLQETTTILRARTLAIHRSRPLLEILHAFNAYSNNDMERVAFTIGTPDQLAAWLGTRWKVPPTSIQLETTSGLGVNRLTARLLVGLMRDLKHTCEQLQIQIDDVLASAGCVPGTVSRFYQKVADEAPGALIGKTGTLTSTDGGVAVFSGIANTEQGPLLFAVAAPRASGKVRTARRREEQWVLDLAARHGGWSPRICSSPLTPPDAGAEVQASRLAGALGASQAGR